MKQFMVILATIFLTGCQQVDAFMDGCPLGRPIYSPMY